jgi:YVTN family beta-propeller protein
LPNCAPPFARSHRRRSYTSYAATHKEVKRLKPGRGAAGILIPPDGARAFVACSPDNYIVIIDLKSLEVTGRLDVGEEPDGMTWSVMR